MLVDSEHNAVLVEMGGYGRLAVVQVGAVMIGFDTATWLARVRVECIEMGTDTLNRSEVLDHRGACLQSFVHKRLWLALCVVCHRKGIHVCIAVTHPDLKVLFLAMERRRR